jgi:GntR family transcriptional regulator, arabinose operon transcriptional repressor
MTPRPPKYQQVFKSIEEDILAGRYSPGQKLPSETALLEQFETSRITVVRALRELQHKGLVQRRAGSGTYVADITATKTNLLFGSLIPDLEDAEIFGPICQGIAEYLQSHKHALLWGNIAPGPEEKETQTLKLCRQFIAQRVPGVFFAPLDLTATNDRTNHAVVSLLEKAGIPIVLLDRGFLPYPERSSHDLVSIDHRYAGYLATNQLLKLGCRRIAFVASRHASQTTESRVAGYRDTLFRAGLPFESSLLKALGSDDSHEIAQLMESQKPDAIVCVNDHTAGQVMQSLIGLNYQIPQDVKIVGFDDVQYANLLPVPLTTIHQPCHDIGVAAAAAMLERLSSPNIPAREILLDCRLVVRDSCGARAFGDQSISRTSDGMLELTRYK